MHASPGLVIALRLGAATSIGALIFAVVAMVLVFGLLEPLQVARRLTSPQPAAA